MNQYSMCNQEKTSYYNDNRGDGNDRCASPQPLPAFTVGGCEVPYKDYLNVSLEETKQHVKPTKETTRKGPRGGVSEPFPAKLYAMLVGVEREGNDHIVSWQPHGRCFLIHSPAIFEKEFLQRYFKQSKLTSFNRQLNLYGFQKVSVGTDRGAHYHPLFLRGRPDLSKIMLRTRVKGGAAPVTSPDVEIEKSMGKPSFYALPACPSAYSTKHSRSVSNNDITVESSDLGQDDQSTNTMNYEIFQSESASYDQESVQVLEGFNSDAAVDVDTLYPSNVGNYLQIQKIEGIDTISEMQVDDEQILNSSLLCILDKTQRPILYCQQNYENNPMPPSQTHCCEQQSASFQNYELNFHYDEKNSNNDVGVFEGRMFHNVDEESVVAYYESLFLKR